MTLAEKQSALISDLNLIQDPHERLAAVMSRRGVALRQDDKTDAALVRGCLSRVWLAASKENGVLHFHTEADSPMVRGLVALLADLYSGVSSVEVIATEPVLWEDTGLTRLLSPTRLNGLAAVRRRICELAASFSEREESMP